MHLVTYMYSYLIAVDFNVPHVFQVVWNNTFEFGIATAVSTSHGLIIVARYNPGGAKGEPRDYKKNIFAKSKYSIYWIYE